MFYSYYKQYGNSVLIRYKKDGDSHTKTKTFKDYQPTLFTHGDSTSTNFSVYDVPLKPIKFDNIKAAKNFAEQYKGIDDFVLEGNSNYGNQFIIELFDGKQPDYNENLIKVGFIDIEVDAPEFPKPEEHKWPINAVTLFDSVEKEFVSFFLRNGESPDWDHSKSPEHIKKLSITAFHFDTEDDLLRSFLSVIQSRNLDVLSGWHSEGFDVPYTINRCNQLFGEKYTKTMLSPFSMINSREVKAKFGKTLEKFEIVGLPHLDYMQLYTKHTYTPRESYKLDFIAHAELGENKISYEEAQGLYGLYRNDFQKFCDYNIQDVNIMVRLEEKLGLFSLVYAMSYFTLSNYEDALGTTRIWEQLVAKFLYNKNKVPPFRRQKREEREFEGAFVKEPVPNFYNWIVSYDLNSLYPHVEMEWNIGMDTLIPYHELPQELKDIRDKHTFDDLLNKRIDLSVLAKYNVTMAANFEFYKKDKMSFFSEIKRELYNNRKAVKKEMLQAEADQQNVSGQKKKELEYIEAKLNNMQLGLKVLLNGGYGALASPYFLYYMVENAEAITMSGQLVNKWTCSSLDNHLKTIFQDDKTNWVAGDTDSGYFTIDSFMKTVKEKDIQKKVDIANRFCEELMKPHIDDKCQELCDYINGYEQKMIWGREVIAENAIWVAKKKYVMQVWDSEYVRYKEPKIKIVGMESVKSSTPEWSRDLLKKCYTTALQKTESDVHKLIEEARDKFYGFTIENIAIPTSVSEVDKYYDPDNLYVKGTPQQSKAALIHNKLVDDLNLVRIPKISGGDKIKVVELKQPNPLRQPVVGFDSYLPREFNLDKYVNYDSILEKSFIKPLTIFLDAINWNLEETNTLF